MSSLKTILSDIKEKYYDTEKISGYFGDSYVELFKNPNRREIEDSLGKWDTIRFYIYDGDVYIWDSGKSYLHHDFIKNLGLSNHRGNIAGQAEYRDGRLVVIETTVMSEARSLDVLEGKYDWLERYYFDMGNWKKELEVKVGEL